MNDLAEPAVLAGLFARDSVQGRFAGEATVDGQTVSVDGHPVRFHLDGLAVRVPVPDGSLTDLVALVRQQPTAESVNTAYQWSAHSVNTYAGAARGDLEGILEYASEPLVSTDVIGSTASCIFDPGLTMVTGHMVKVLGWFDNEAGYSARLIDLAALIGAA